MAFELKEPVAKRGQVSTKPVFDFFRNWKQDAANDLQGGALNLLESDIMTDITLVVEDKEFRGHKVILAAVSPYFRSMFSGGFREENEEKIPLKEMSAATFEVVLDFIYSRSNGITSDNVVDILKTAHMLQINCLQIECKRFIVHHLSEENSIDMLKIATSMSWQDLEENSRKYVLRNFMKISKGPYFPLLNLNEMIKLISRDEINTPIEEHVFQAVIKWMKYDEKERQPLIADILEHVRFPLMRAESLIAIKAQYAEIFEDRKCDLFWAEACQYHMVTSRRHEMFSKRTQNRSCSPYVNSLIAICETKDRNGAKVVAYDFVREVWKTVGLEQDNDYVRGACITYANASGNGGHIFCLMEYDWHRPRGMYVLDFDFQTRKIESTKIEYRIKCSIVVVGSFLICIGGINPYFNNHYAPALDDPKSYETSVMEYDLSKGTKSGKKNIGDILVPVQDMSTAVIGTKIYLFGGKTQSEDKSSIVQCFDTLTNQCVRVGELPEPISFSRSVNVDDTAYVFSKSGTVIEVTFFPDFSARIFGKFENFDFVKFAVCFRDDIFWVFNCRESNETRTSWIRVMKRKTGQEVTMTQLPKEIPKDYHKIVDIIPFVIPKECLYESDIDVAVFPFKLQ